MTSIWAADFIGIPYLAQGRARDGADCYGLVVLVYREIFGIELPLLTLSPAREGRERDEWVSKWETGVANDWRTITPGQEEVGDCVDLTLLGLPHCGIVVGNGNMLHSHASSGSRIESYKGMFFCRRVKSFCRHRAR